MADAPRLDHALLTERQRDEGTELDDLRVAEMRPQILPHTFGRAFGIPDQHARVQERGLLTFGEAIGAFELQQLGVVLLGESLLSAPERSLGPSVVALDGLRNIDAAELLERVLNDAVPEDRVPRSRERLGDRGNVRANGLRLRAWSPEPARVVQVRPELGISEAVFVDIADASHRSRF